MGSLLRDCLAILFIALLKTKELRMTTLSVLEGVNAPSPIYLRGECPPVTKGLVVS
jgi:hypothetical protein